MVADAGVADFTFTLQLFQRAGALFRMGQVIDPVQLIEVDVVGAQPLERCLTTALDVGCREIEGNVLDDASATDKGDIHGFSFSFTLIRQVLQ